VSAADEPRTRRLFVALMVGEGGGALMAEVVEALGGEDAPRRFRLPRAEGLHATLFFLGDVAAERIEPLRERLATETADRVAPRLVIDRAGAFPKRRRERVLWLGVREEGVDPVLPPLQKSVLRAVRGAGFDTAEDERRPFRPHVTVARPRDARRPGVSEAFYALAPGRPWNPRAVALVEAVRAPGGPNVYRPIAELPLVPPTDAGISD